MEKAQFLLKHKVEKYSEKLGVKPDKVDIKNFRWDSTLPAQQSDIMK